MGRRASKTVVALLALTLFVQTPVFAVSRDRDAEPGFLIRKIAHVIKKIVRNLAPALNDGDPGTTFPGPPKP